MRPLRKRQKLIRVGPYELTLAQAALPGIVLMLVGVIFLLKPNRIPTQSPNNAASGAAPALIPADQPPETPPNLFQDAVANSPKQDTPVADILPETQLDQYLAVNQPVLAFFHSNDCEQCVKMIEVVEQVYPDFAGSVALVDVNVYEKRNANLLRRAGIRAIPTMLFIDSAGQGQVVMGLMESDVFRQHLQQLARE